ncbi:MAG: 50S ribosomal protein L18 [Candidatus Neomarinimicrobiota bacterium]
MIKTHERKTELYQRRRRRSKKRLDRYSGKLRLVVTRSARHITGQIIDDQAGHTLVSASSMEKALADVVQASTSKVDLAYRIGKILAERAAGQKVSTFVFDRNGYHFHGRVKALATGAREGGLKF